MNSSEYAGCKCDLSEFSWINPPKVFTLENGRLTILTEPETDYWQRTYYGFQNYNAPTFINAIEGDFTFVVKSGFNAVNQYDQCGVILYQDNENWVKASVEYENENFSRLGSVVTNFGYSDWASTDISSAVNSMWYRLSRRGQDFYLEHSSDGKYFHQMRVFHMHFPFPIAQAGIYACSPLKSSFKAIFSNFEIGSCKWPDLH